MSDRRVTGTALKRIIEANKQYIDSNDLGFVELQEDEDTGNLIDPETGLNVEIVMSKCEELYEEEVDEIIGNVFD